MSKLKYESMKQVAKHVGSDTHERGPEHEAKETKGFEKAEHKVYAKNKRMKMGKATK